MSGSIPCVSCERIVHHTWNMAGGAIDALKIPDGLAGFREMVCEESTTVFTVKNASEAPLMTLQGSQIQDLYHQQVSWHGGLALVILHTEWATQIVHLQKEG